VPVRVPVQNCTFSVAAGRLPLPVTLDFDDTLNMTKRTERAANEVRIAELTSELAAMRSELAGLDAAGLSNDLKAVFLREGVAATDYLLSLLVEQASEPDYDRRFLARNRPSKR
jgi:hypothetical protein